MYRNSMKKMDSRTRKFINKNIQLNATVSSYPIRKVAPGVSVENSVQEASFDSTKVAKPKAPRRIYRTLFFKR